MDEGTVVERGVGAVADWGPGVGLVWETTRSGPDRVEGVQSMAPRMAGPPVHVHPEASESFHVLEGEIEVLVDGTWGTYRAGETATAAAGVPHSVRNRSDRPAKVLNSHWPGAGMEDFFLDGGRLAAEGKIKALPPKDLRSAIYASMLFAKYPSEIRVTGPERYAFAVLATIGRALGRRV